MELVILGLKRKSDGKYFIYDVEGRNGHIPINKDETKQIDTLSPFPFSNYSSLDDDAIDFKKYKKCYLKVNGQLSTEEYNSMKSSGIVYHRFYNREVTLLEEFHEIFQYSLKMLNSFGESLGTYDLTTWVIHNETKNENEYRAMKEIIFKAVQNKKRNKEYPLDISLDKYTSHYISYFRELSHEGYNITFGRYGTCDRNPDSYKSLELNKDDLLFILKEFGLEHLPFLEHPSFTSEFYNTYIAGTTLEYHLMNSLSNETLSMISKKGLNFDDIYKRIFKYRIAEIDPSDYEYETVEQMFNDENFETYTKHHSPYDYYCCEDCDGYDIHEMYSEEELEGETEEVDERVNVVCDLLEGWHDYISEDCYSLFDFVSDDILIKITGNKFVEGMLSKRKQQL